MFIIFESFAFNIYIYHLDFTFRFIHFDLFILISSNKIMLYQILFLWISTFTIIVHSDRTTLSKEQCPSHFYMSEANTTYVTSTEAQSSVSFFYSLYDKQ
jgi:hypothetical protein